MMVGQKENTDYLIEILLVLITSEFATAKTMPSGFFDRDMWHTVNRQLSELMDMLK